MCNPRGAEGAVVRNKAGAGELRWGGFGIGAEGGERGGGWTLHTTSGSSACGQGGCQALGWIAGDCWGDCGERQGRKMNENRKDGTS